MNILITGGAGFIGSEIVRQLSKKDEYNITVLDAMTEQIHGKNFEDSYLYSLIKEKCRFIKADIRDYTMIEHALKGIDIVMHLAAQTGTGQSMYEINEYNDINIMGTSNLFQAILTNKFDVKKFILASSRSVYGEGKYKCPIHGTIYPSGRKTVDMWEGDFRMYCPICKNELILVPTDEESKIAPKSLYAFTKFAQEKMVETMCNAMNIKYTIFRFQNVYGIGQSLKNPYTGILSVFSTLMLDNKPVNIFEDGQESRDFINVKDVASAVIASLNNTKTNDEIVNLGSGKGTSVIEIANMLKEMYGSTSSINITGDFRVGDIAHNVADITKAVQILKFSPLHCFDEGLREFTKWVIEQGTGDIQYEKSLLEMEHAGMFFRRENAENGV